MEFSFYSLDSFSSVGERLTSSHGETKQVAQFNQKERTRDFDELFDLDGLRRIFSSFRSC
jgi:hypothetical protein